MRAHLLKSVLLISLGFLSINAFCAQPNAHENDQAHNQQRDARYDRCNRHCNRICDIYGQKCLLLLGIGTLCYLGSLYIKPSSGDGSFANITVKVPAHAKHLSVKTTSPNLSAQAALFNFKNARFKAKPNDSQHNKRKKHRK